jgi:hypothetical protein
MHAHFNDMTLAVRFRQRVADQILPVEQTR